MKKNEFNVRLKEIRLAVGVSQGDLAVYLGVSRTTLSNWESQRNELLLSHEMYSKIWLMSNECARYLVDRPVSEGCLILTPTDKRLIRAIIINSNRKKGIITATTKE